MAWKFDPKLSVSYQIAQRIRLQILNGVYAPGQQFPTVRQLANDAAVNPNTVQKSLTILEGEVLLQSRGTVGRFVTDDLSIISNAREALQREYMERILTEAKDLGITRTQFMAYLKEKEELQ